MEVKKQMVLREIAGDYALIPVGDTVIENNGLFSLSETGARIWELLPQADGAEQLVDALLEEYDVDRETLSRDVDEFLEQLRQMEIL